MKMKPGRKPKYVGFETDALRVISYDYTTRRYHYVCKRCGKPGSKDVDFACELKIMTACGHCTRFRLPPGEGSFNVLYRAVEASAKERGIAWNLTPDRFRELTSANCYYCGTVPKQKIGRSRETFGMYTYNGVDRVDSSKGYEDGNVVPSCKVCNFAKHVLSQREFSEWIKRAHSHLVVTRWDAACQAPESEVLGDNTVVHAVCGVSGSGKTRMCSTLQGVRLLSYDKLRRGNSLREALVEASRQGAPIVLDIPMKVSTAVRNNPDFKFKLYCIVETQDIIRERLASRGGTFTSAAEKRIRRMSKLATRAHVGGTYAEVENILRLDLAAFSS